MGFEQSFYSIVKFVEGVRKAPSIYAEEPKTNERPFTYFPPPDIVTIQRTTRHFAYLYTVIVQTFDNTSELAYNSVVEIANAINVNRMSIPIVDISGKETKERIKFSRVDFRKSEQGVATLTLDFESFEPFTTEVHGNIKKFFINFKIKE